MLYTEAVKDTSQKQITLKVTPELHTRLRIQAAKEGTTLQDLLTTWAEEKLSERKRMEPAVPPVERPVRTPGERRARVAAAVGPMRGVPGSVEAFLREKHEDMR
jgi:hypothetical protein